MIHRRPTAGPSTLRSWASAARGPFSPREQRREDRDQKRMWGAPSRKLASHSPRTFGAWGTGGGNGWNTPTFLPQKALHEQCDCPPGNLALQLRADRVARASVVVPVYRCAPRAAGTRRPGPPPLREQTPPPLFAQTKQLSPARCPRLLLPANAAAPSSDLDAPTWGRLGGALPHPRPVQTNLPVQQRKAARSSPENGFPTGPATAGPPSPGPDPARDTASGACRRSSQSPAAVAERSAPGGGSGEWKMERGKNAVDNISRRT